MERRTVLLALNSTVCALSGAAIIFGAANYHPAAVIIGAIGLCIGLAGYAWLAVTAKKPTPTRETSFIKGGKIGELVLEDNEFTADKFVDGGEIQKFSARNNRHEPKA